MGLCRILLPGDAFFWHHFAVAELSLMTSPREVLRVRMGLVVDIHQLADGGVRVLLSSRKRPVAEQFLNCAEIGAIGKQMRGECVPQRVRMQIPVHIREPNVFFHDTSDGALRQATPGII